MTVRVCFVCLGNICRSPTAEVVMQHLVDEAGLGDRIEVDSAGTAGYHVGEPPDDRAVAEARRHGLEMVSLGRKVAPPDLDRFDLLVAMDRANWSVLREMAGTEEQRERVRLLCEFASDQPGLRDVPDPYYGGEQGFSQVFEMVSDACANLLEHLRRTHDLA